MGRPTSSTSRARQPLPGRRASRSLQRAAGCSPECGARGLLPRSSRRAVARPGRRDAPFPRCGLDTRTIGVPSSARAGAAQCPRRAYDGLGEVTRRSDEILGAGIAVKADRVTDRGLRSEVAVLVGEACLDSPDVIANEAKHVDAVRPGQLLTRVVDARSNNRSADVVRLRDLDWCSVEGTCVSG